MDYFIISIIMLLFAALSVLFVKEEFKLKFCTIISFIAFATGMFPVTHVFLKGVPLEYTFSETPLFGDILLSMDALSAIFAGIIFIMGFIALIYSNGYLKHYLNKKYQFSAHCCFLM